MERIDVIVQAGAFLFGTTAITLVSTKGKFKRLGYIFGMCSQPFWILGTILNQQWGMLASCLVYTVSWGIGIYNYWIKK